MFNAFHSWVCDVGEKKDHEVDHVRTDDLRTRRIAGTMMWDDAARPDRGMPGKRRSPPPCSIFQAAPLGFRRGRRGNRTSHLGGDAARRAAAAPACARGQALHEPVPTSAGSTALMLWSLWLGESSSKRSRSLVWCFFSLSLKEDLQTLCPVENGTFSTYLHAHMPKINSSHVKICKSSQKVLKRFSELGLQNFTIVRSVLVRLL